MSEHSHWLSLEEPWRIAITLAWEAYVGGNLGVGAVLTDSRGRVVAVGRNRVSDTEAPPGRLRSTYIAHAELDVLGQLTPGNYRDHTLWTTLEPCPLCCMAIVTSNVGSVAFAARDRLWDGISRLAELNEFIANRWPVRRGPLGGAPSVFCELLPLLWFLEHKPDGSVVARYRSHHPRLLTLAETLRSDARFADLRTHPVDFALRHLWTDLAAIETK
ncbi:MAG TPA: nucleoside deaminase [Candidatus Binataceae bacterium]|nr:nucleoside deaminase [Candidatus Binataceae bacterium]